jgi:CheY-like chemotaxis protein
MPGIPLKVSQTEGHEGRLLLQSMGICPARSHRERTRGLLQAAPFLQTAFHPFLYTVVKEKRINQTAGDAVVISVLYADHDPDLLKSGKAFLEKNGIISVDTETSVQGALKRFGSKQYDIVVSGDMTGKMDGVHLLKSVRAAGRIPFIFFSRRKGEDFTIEALNSGAGYYLARDANPEEMFPDLFQLIITATKIQESRQFLLDFITILPIPSFIIDEDHVIRWWNHALEDYTGFSAERMIGTSDHWKPFYDHQRPCLADLVVDGAIDGLYRLYNGKNPRVTPVTGAYEAADFFPSIKGGTLLFFTAVPVRYADGSVAGAVETLQDISRIGGNRKSTG